MSAPVPRFVGNVEENGNLYIAEREQFDRYLSTLKGAVEVVVRKWRKNRSLDQNAYYWGVVLKLISEHTGHTTQELHEVFKQRYLPPQTVAYQDKTYLIRLTTTSKSTKEFAEYVDTVILEAATLGVEIPSPTKVEV